VRYQELRDARLVIQENHSIQEWKRIQLERDFGQSAGAVTESSADFEGRSSLRYRAVFALWCCLVMSIGWVTPASASYVKQSALDAIARSYRIPITDPENRVTLPSVLSVASATLDTTNPFDSQLHAPRGRIFLSLQMSSGPIQRTFGDPLWGSYFTAMTPLPATALRYVAASGRSYAVTRMHPVVPGSDPNGGVVDGLIAADYYVVVPISNRRGTFIISSTRTIGEQYESFMGIAEVDLDVGGPTKIPLAFPNNLTATEPTPAKTSPSPGEALGTVFNLFATVMAALLLGVVFLKQRRADRNGRPRPVYVVRSGPMTKSPARVFEQEPAPHPQSVVPAAAKSVDALTTLRVDVLGPLSISPVNAPASDPVRAIVAFLAMNTGRLFSLDEIQTAIWPLTNAGTDIKKPAMRNYMVDARKTVGARHLPTASGRAGYELRDFTTDWTEFQRLLDDAKKTAKDSALALRRQALDLTKGLPFTADTSRYFTWTLTSSVVYKMVDAVTTLAHELGTTYVMSGDLATAQVVLRQGLVTDPASLTLWEDLTDVLLESTDQSLLDLHWGSANVVLRAEDVALLRSRSNG
jgi:DNA-binding SARP family transcriptional activator